VTTQREQQKQSEQQEQSEIHRCDKCGERTRHIVVLVARDHSQDIMPKDPRKAFWQAFRTSTLTNWALSANAAARNFSSIELLSKRHVTERLAPEPVTANPQAASQIRRQHRPSVIY